jgi:hypothetical protein
VFEAVQDGLISRNKLAVSLRNAPLTANTRQICARVDSAAREWHLPEIHGRARKCSHEPGRRDRFLAMGPNHPLMVNEMLLRYDF